MATSAARSKARARAERSPSSDGNSPRRWWQWILVYPAFFVALLTAAPQWYDKARLSLEGINKKTVADAERQAQLWRKNLSCSASPFAWYSNPSNVKVDATICDSGDIFVRAVTPSNGQFFKWLPLDEVVQVAQPAQPGGVVPTAHAATLDELLPTAPQSPAGRFLRQAQMVNILCQKFIDGRRIMRRVQTPQGCFDEIIDTYNGAVISRTAAPCTPSC